MGGFVAAHDVEASDGCGVNLVDPEKVGLVRSALPPETDIVELSDVFSLLGDPGRLRLLMSLLEGGELCVCDLAATTAMSESSVSHALRLLRAHRVVSVSRRGRMAYYRLDDGHVRMLLDLGLTHTGHTIAVHPERTGAGRKGATP
ncbi:helix-turn-helix transcriptional regulator [Paenarthrobacter sp. Z7-10]|uniref:ArsR/SmtB family transcription factor n=1 Tax=Paenarthrobacter sp. Z7-10 TaxID=2787635 RepID=UPI0022A97E81|nr:metalloregulator ArsR/SmtB family transcription factor [Paenarthrobacter sp. Z7-10]MCZ2404434.1 helix-turn-helix transcriptional regulator [Paenarthrobacter sp. Z7-10]